jgi:putative transcriptional regulator
MEERILANLRDHRKNAGLTQEDLAAAMRVSRQTIISIERGRYIPSLPLALKIARFFKRPVDDIFELQEEKQDDR